MPIVMNSYPLKISEIDDGLQLTFYTAVVFLSGAMSVNTSVLKQN